MYQQILAILSFLPGFLDEEIDLAELAEVLAGAEVPLPLSASPGDRLHAAVRAVIDDADRIFLKSDWFRGVALAFLMKIAPGSAGGTTTTTTTTTVEG